MGVGTAATGGTNVAGFTRLQTELRHIGAETHLIAMLGQAIEADQLLEAILLHDPSQPETHPLAQGVMNRPATQFLLWPLTSTPPALLKDRTAASRRGPVPAGPTLSSAERQAFYQRLQAVADRSSRHLVNEPSLLLRRQVFYLAASDKADATGRWLLESQHAEQRRLVQDKWSPIWVAQRSLLVATARRGDREPLQRFIATALTEQDELEAANLNYWAYWAGESSSVEPGDTFMAASDLGHWRGGTLLARLTDDLAVDNAVIDLCAHSVWALLHRRGHLLLESTRLTTQLREQVDTALDSDQLSAQARRELENVAYAIRVARSFLPPRI